jgi:general stress protein YciG
VSEPLHAYFSSDYFVNILEVTIVDFNPHTIATVYDCLQKHPAIAGHGIFCRIGKNGVNVMERKEEEKKKTSNRGFASMSPEQQRAIARKGGEAVSRNREHMASIGSRGGEAVSKNREHMSQIGRKGGEAVSQDREHMKRIGRKGGERGRGSLAKSQKDQGEESMKENQKG